MISREKAREGDERLATMLDWTPSEVRDYLAGRTTREGARFVDGELVTGLRRVYGTHGYSYRLDEDGTDRIAAWEEPPPGYTPPPWYRPGY